MNSENSKLLKEALQAIYNSKGDSYLTLSTVINDNLKIVLDEFPKVNISSYYNDMMNLLKYLRDYISKLTIEYISYAKLLEKDNEDLRQTCITNITKLKDKICLLEVRAKMEKSKNEKEKSELKGEIVNLKKEIDKLKEVLICNEKEKSKLSGDITNLTEKVDNLEGQKAELEVKIDNLSEKVNNLEEEKSKLNKTINDLKINNGRLELKIEDLNKTLIEQKKLHNHTTKERDEQKEINESFEVKNKELSEKIKSLESQFVGIQNRENYKSIIYILLIFCGIKFADIGGSIYWLIQNNVKNTDIQKILKESYRFYDRHRFIAHDGYTSNIMSLLFPTSKFKEKITDDIINKTKDLLFRYENSWNMNDPSKANDIEKEIESLTSEIRKLNLGN